MAQIHLLLRFVVFEIEQMPFAGVPNDSLHAAQASEIEPKIEYPPSGGGAEVLEHLWPLGHFQHYENSITVRLYQFLITAVDIDVDLSTARLVCMAPTP